MKELVDRETLQKIGQYLRNIRQLAGLSQAEAAERAGFSSGYISVIEGGHREVSKKTLFQLATAYSHVTLGEMVEAISNIEKGMEPTLPVISKSAQQPTPERKEASPTTTRVSSERVSLETTSVLLLLDGALEFIRRDPSFQLPLEPKTPEAKVMAVSMYQAQNPERRLLTDEELQRIIESE